jgi:hypothetical protein
MKRFDRIYGIPHAPDDRRVAGFLAYAPALAEGQLAWLEDIGEELLADDDPNGYLVGALLVRCVRLERDLAHCREVAA